MPNDTGALDPRHQAKQHQAALIAAATGAVTSLSRMLALLPREAPDRVELLHALSVARLLVTKRGRNG